MTSVRGQVNGGLFTDTIYAGKETTETKIASASLTYDILACACTINSDGSQQCDDSPSISQNSISHICLSLPSDVDSSTIFHSVESVTLHQDDVTYEAVSNNEPTPGLTMIEGEGTASAVLKIRMLSVFFDRHLGVSELTPIDISGVVRMGFQSSQQRGLGQLALTATSSERERQEENIEGHFKVKVELTDDIIASSSSSAFRCSILSLVSISTVAIFAGLVL